jgi:hypothetical protein
VPVAHRVVSDESHLVRRDALDLAADEEEARKRVASACFVTRPPAPSSASNVGSGFSSTSVPLGVMLPRLSGRSG